MNHVLELKSKFTPLMRDEDNNFGGSLVWSLENDDVTWNSRIIFTPSVYIHSIVTTM